VVGVYLRELSCETHNGGEFKGEFPKALGGNQRVHILPTAHAPLLRFKSFTTYPASVTEASWSGVRKTGTGPLLTLVFALIVSEVALENLPNAEVSEKIDNYAASVHVGASILPRVIDGPVKTLLPTLGLDVESSDKSEVSGP